jgi:hypothetical protein
MPELLYPLYREYTQNRVIVNNAMMAMLAGSRLASHTLQLTAGSDRTLAELFPAVEHIGRFNLRSDLARNLLANADYHLASVAIPYALSAHEDYVMGSIDMLRNEGVTILTGGKQIRAWNMHPVLFASAGVSAPTDSLEVFDLLREMRNCTTHEGGRPSVRLTNHMNVMGSLARDEWERLTGRPVGDVVRDGKVALLAEDVFAAFAITKTLGRDVNKALATAVPASAWARVAVDDFVDSTTKTKNSSSWRRSLLGFVRQNYALASISEPQLELAARQGGHWTVAVWQ